MISKIWDAILATVRKAEDGYKKLPDKSKTAIRVSFFLFLSFGWALGLCDDIEKHKPIWAVIDSIVALWNLGRALQIYSFQHDRKQAGESDEGDGIAIYEEE